MARHVFNLQRNLIFPSSVTEDLCGHFIAVQVLLRVTPHTDNEPACCSLVLGPTNGASVFAIECNNRAGWKSDWRNKCCHCQGDNCRYYH